MVGEGVDSCSTDRGFVNKDEGQATAYQSSATAW